MCHMMLLAEVPNSALSNSIVHDGASASFNHGQYLHKRESDTRRPSKACRYGKNANTHLKPNLLHNGILLELGSKLPLPSSSGAAGTSLVACIQRSNRV